MGALAALLLGQDAGFDLRNYHWHNAWALLHGRLHTDVAPGQLQSFFNPLVDLPYFGALALLGGAAGTAVMGALHGLGIGIVGLIAREVGFDRLLVGVSMASAAWAPVFLDGVGGSSGDLLIGAIVLGGLLALLRGNPALAGVLTGAAVGLKPTAAVFAIALVVAAWLRRDRLRRIALGGIGGWALTGAFWAITLLLATGNPVFPMANHVFGSEWASAEHFGELGYLPSGLGWITLPLDMALGGEAAWRIPWRDGRWLVLWVLGIAWVLTLLISRRGAKAQRHAKGLGALLAWAGVAWVFWEWLSSLIRYLAPLEAMSGVLVLLVLRELLGARGRAVGLVVLAVLAVWMRPPPAARVPFEDDVHGVVLPALPTDERPVVLITTGDAALGYLAPAFPDRFAHLRVSSSIVFYGEGDATALNRRITETLANATSVHLLRGPDDRFDAEALEVLGLPPPTTCAPVASRLDGGLALCRLR